MIALKGLAFCENLPIPTEMIFTGEDPYTIQFLFHHQGAVTAWSFSKELLDALSEDMAAGDGDVRFELNEDEHKVYMHLRSPEGAVSLEFDPCLIEEFLEEVDFSPEFAHAQVEITDDEIYGWLGAE